MHYRVRVHHDDYQYTSLVEAQSPQEAYEKARTVVGKGGIRLAVDVEPVIDVAAERNIEPLRPKRITAAYFKEATGRKHEGDDLERANCKQVGQTGHRDCGWCFTCKGPNYECGHLQSGVAHGV